MEVDQTSAMKMKRVLLIINLVILGIGNCSPLVMRLYFLKGGKRIWFSSWLGSCGWPIILIPLTVSYTRRSLRPTTEPANLVLMKPRVFLAAAVIGVLTGLDDYMYACGVSKLPISTTALITAGFAFLLVKQKFTAYSINAVVLLTLAAMVLALHANGDRPEGESSREYWMGFFMTVAASALYGFILPLVELTYMKGKQAITYTLIMEIQLVMCFFASVFCIVGMIINNDFQAISREAKVYELGEAAYYVVVVSDAITSQCFFLGAIGVIFYSSSLLSGIVIAVFIPVVEVLGVVFYHESFKAEKGVSLFLSLWGFISYFFGEIKATKKMEKSSNSVGDYHNSETQLVQQICLE